MSATHGVLELQVLASIDRLGGRAFGSRLADDVGERRGKPLPPGRIYTVLRQLREKGLVDDELSAPEPVQGGGRKRLYTLTEGGRRAVREGLGQHAESAEGDGEPEPEPSDGTADRGTTRGSPPASGG